MNDMIPLEEVERFKIDDADYKPGIYQFKHSPTVFYFLLKINKTVNDPWGNPGIEENWQVIQQDVRFNTNRFPIEKTSKDALKWTGAFERGRLCDIAYLGNELTINLSIPIAENARARR